MSQTEWQRRVESYHAWRYVRHWVTKLVVGTLSTPDRWFTERPVRTEAEMRNDLPDGDRLITAKEIAALLSISRAQVFRLKDAGKLPLAVYLSPRTLRWRLSDIQRYIEEL